MGQYELPKDERDIVNALDDELTQGEIEANVNLVAWKIIDAYLQGVRHFRVRDRWAGNVSIGFENSKGELDLRYEEVTAQFQTELGRYMKMDLNPVVTRIGESLGSLRDAAISQAYVTSQIAHINLDEIKRRAFIPLLKYGNVGVFHYETGIPNTPDGIELIHPRQLRPFPAFVDGLGNLSGIVRKRWVPLGWLIKIGKKKGWKVNLAKKNPEKDLKGQSVPYGMVPPGLTSFESAASMPGSAKGSSRYVLGADISDPDRNDKPVKKDGRWFVPLEEWYFHDQSQQYVSEFIIKIGNTIVMHENYEDNGLQIIRPLRVARHTDIDRFFARGYVAPLIPFNHQQEKMLSALFKNVAEIDMFGTLFVAGGSGIDLKKWKPGPRPKIMKYEPYPIDSTHKPFQLGPMNSGKLPADIIKISGELSKQLARQGSIYSGETSGRVDSAAGLGFLFNTGNVALGPPSHSIADAFSGVYSRIVQAGRERSKPGDTIQLTTITDGLAGVIINAEGKMELSDNPIPDPIKVKIDIKDRTPRDRDIRKKELLELYGQQLVDPTRFWITALEENLDFPGPPKELWETWRKVVWQIMILFRDGKSPGELQVGEHTQSPDIQLIALQQFMNRIEYSLAAPEVRTEFENWKMQLETLAGIGFPAGLGQPEDVAMQAMAQGQGQMPIGGQP